MKLPDPSKSEPYFVAKRLRSLTVPNIRRCDEAVVAYINQAADMINAQGKKIAALSLRIANYERERPIGLPRTAPHGRLLRAKTPELIAQKIVDAVDGVCDLWLGRCGGYRLVRTGAFGIGQFVMTLDERTTFHEVYCKIVGKPIAKAAPRNAPIGLVRPGKDQAEKVAELLSGPVDLYRVTGGAIRVVRADQKSRGEFLGRFDEGADFQDIKDAIE